MLVRSLRSSLVDVFSAEYIEAARARGLSESRIVLKHALRNSLIATITVLAVNLGWLISSAVMIERVFDIPGLGKLLVESIYTRDFPTIQALTLVFGLLVIAINLLSDVAYAPSTRACGTADGDPARGHPRIGRAAQAPCGERAPLGERVPLRRGRNPRARGLAAIFAPLIAPVPAQRPGPRQRVPAALDRASHGHGQSRPRHLLAGRLRGPGRSPDRLHHHLRPAGLRRHPRGGGRLLRRAGSTR